MSHMRMTDQSPSRTADNDTAKTSLREEKLPYSRKRKMDQSPSRMDDNDTNNYSQLNMGGGEEEEISSHNNNHVQMLDGGDGVEDDALGWDDIMSLVTIPTNDNHSVKIEPTYANASSLANTLEITNMSTFSTTPILDKSIMGNSGDVSQGRCGGGVPYCGPRGARFK